MSVNNPYKDLIKQQKEPDFFNKDARKEGAVATAGTVLKNSDNKADVANIIDAFKTVEDPEIPVNLYDLGLIYNMQQHANGDVEVLMTLTAPNCPVAGEMPKWVADAVAKVQGTGVVTVTLTWTPKWTKNMMSDDAKMALDFF